MDSLVRRIAFVFVLNPELRAIQCPSVERKSIRDMWSVENEQPEGQAEQNQTHDSNPGCKPDGRDAAESGRKVDRSPNKQRAEDNGQPNVKTHGHIIDG